MRSVKLALAAALALTAVAVGVTLTRAPLTVAGTNSVPVEAPVALTRGDASSCQTGTVPRGTTGIRLSIASGAGPRLRVTVLAGGRVVSKGERGAGWGLTDSVVVPIGAMPRTVADARICVSLGRAPEPVPVLGTPLRHGSPEQLGFADVTLRMEYLRPGSGSWLSRASSIAYHMGLGRAASGTWIVFFALVLMIAAGALAVRLALKELQ